MGKRYDFWALVEPSEIEGVWVAHAPDFDIVSQGKSPVHAVEMLCESLAFVIEHDLNAGLDPRDRQAPKECYAPIDAIRESGRKVSPEDIDVRSTDSPPIFAVNMALHFAVVEVELSIPAHAQHPVEARDPEWNVPLYLLNGSAANHQGC